MVAGLAFLSKKSFNPKNLTNQKQVWEARQKKANDEKKAHERSLQLKREKDEEELAFARDGTRGAAQSTLKFMYDVPPGLKKQQKESSSSNDGKKPSSSAQNGNGATIDGGGHQVDLTKRQPGDDDAAAAFRQMLAAASTPSASEHAAADGTSSTDPSNGGTFAFSNESGAPLQGTTVESDKSKRVHMSELEKAVGKRTAGGMTLEEQIARFPQLKDAPMAKGMTPSNVHVSFKPLGTQLRNVRCLACGVWGHSRGDRECEVSGWNPFSAGTSGATRGVAGAAAAGNSNISGLKRRPSEQQPERDDKGERSERRRKKKSKRKRKYSSGSSDSESDSDSSSVSSDEEEERRRRRRRRKKERKRRRKDERRSRRRDRSPEHGRRRNKSSRRYDSDSN